MREPASYAKPLITPSGAEIVLSMRREGAVYVVSWDGSGLPSCFERLHVRPHRGHGALDT